MLPGGPLRVDQLEVVLPVLCPAVVGRRVEVLAGLLVRVLHRQRHLAASDGQNLKRGFRSLALILLNEKCHETAEDDSNVEKTVYFASL